MQKSIRFFIKILPVFLARVKPASHMAKPACIKNTSAAPSSTQIVLAGEYVIFVTSVSVKFPTKKAPGAIKHTLAPCWNEGILRELPLFVKGMNNQKTMAYRGFA